MAFPAFCMDLEAMAFLTMQVQVVKSPNLNVKGQVKEQKVGLVRFELLTIGSLQVVIVEQKSKKLRVKPLAVQFALCLLHFTALCDAFQQLCP